MPIIMFYSLSVHCVTIWIIGSQQDSEDTDNASRYVYYRSSTVMAIETGEIQPKAAQVSVPKRCVNITTALSTHICVQQKWANQEVMMTMTRAYPIGLICGWDFGIVQ
eukprot:773784_1